MESDIGAAAAFVFAHGEALQGMDQMCSVIKDAYNCSEGECTEAAQAELDLVHKVLFCIVLLHFLC
jgi:formiminotetrahydrofolate cyclodeaminase